MPHAGPNFSPFPFGHVRKLRARDAAIESALARWIAARPLGARVAALVGGPVTARLIGVRADGTVRPAAVDPGAATRVLAHRCDAARELAFDPHAARAEVRVGGLAFELLAA
ncbi:MAG: hypothetical protein SFX73_02465, partial [Kofleriaceae bacterium]|nr:hypothetical protein [Kofleriaceae bacterium]